MGRCPGYYCQVMNQRVEISAYGSDGNVGNLFIA
jgi:hypothetical protein